MKNKMKKGFTLIEVMVVIVILGLLASVVVPNIMGKSKEAKINLACLNIKHFDTQLQSFKMDNGKYPTTEEGLNALLSNPNPEKYKKYPKTPYLNMKKIPADPWGNDFIYMKEGKTPNIYSMGPDGEEDTEDDISLENCE